MVQLYYTKTLLLTIQNQVNFYLKQEMFEKDIVVSEYHLWIEMNGWMKNCFENLFQVFHRSYQNIVEGSFLVQIQQLNVDYHIKK